MRLSLSRLGLCNLVFAVAIVAVGFASSFAAIRGLTADVTIRAIRSGQVIDNVEVVNSISSLSLAARTSNAAHNDLAIALLALPLDSSFEVMTGHAKQAVDQLRLYLSSAPADSIAWGNLAVAELKAGDMSAAITSFKMSILIAPESDSILWRCSFALSIFSNFDLDDRKIIAKQFAYAMATSPRDFIQLIRQRNAIVITRELFADDQFQKEKFESNFLLYR